MGDTLPSHAMTSFADLPLLPTLQGTLVEKNLTRPTEIQARAVPALLAGRSVVGVAETGSGKTIAYALPILHRLKTLELQGNPVTVYGEPRAIVVVPTRELGEQRSEEHTSELQSRFGTSYAVFCLNQQIEPT